MAVSASWPQGSLSEDMIDDLCTVVKGLYILKMEFRTYDFIRPAQLKVRLMKCGKLFSFGSDHAFYSTIRPLLDRVSALSCHHCE